MSAEIIKKNFETDVYFIYFRAVSSKGTCL